MAPELYDDSVGFLLFANVESIFEGERLEVEFVTGVVVGRDGFRVGVDHDGLVADFLQREGGVDAAVIEFDALADAIGAASENNDFFIVGLVGFVFVSIARVVVGSSGFEFGCAGVDKAVARSDSETFSFGANFQFLRVDLIQ